MREICESLRKCEAIEDIHAPASYRQQLATVLPRRALLKAHERIAEGEARHERDSARSRSRSTARATKRRCRCGLTLADFLPPSARTHRHASRLRARRVRRLHDLVRRALGALLPDACGAGRRPRIMTVEGIAPDADTLHPLQEAFRDNHGLQCGFCTPGILTTLIELLRDNPDPTEEDMRIGISGNLCRCTGYQNIVLAALDAAKRLQKSPVPAPRGSAERIPADREASGRDCSRNPEPVLDAVLFTTSLPPAVSGASLAAALRRYRQPAESLPSRLRSRGRGDRAKSSAFRAPRSIASRRAKSPRSKRWRTSPICCRSRCRPCSASASNISPRR